MATLGCKVNQAETETLAAEFARAGFERVDFGEVADVYVVNTCTVTHIADRKSRQLVRQARRLNGQGLVVATGCYAEVDPEAVARAGGVDVVVGNADKDRLVELVRGALPELTPGPPVARAGGGRTRAFVKVQTGCDNWCTYCIVPRARGRQHSEPLEDVVSEVSARCAEGYREVVLTGVHVGAYGRDRGDGSSLADLLRAVLARTAVERVRLSSLEPEDLGADLLALWRYDEGRLCRHFHLPLQSGSDGVLRRMGRRYRTSDFARLVAEVRREVPGGAVTTDLMVGFPGESDDEYRESREFVRQLAFAGIHVFKYSPRPGTPAARLPGRVPAPVAKARSEEMMALAHAGRDAFRRAFVGQTLAVLYEDEVTVGGTRCWSGLTDNYVRVYARSNVALANRLEPTVLDCEEADGLAGRLEGATAASGIALA